MTYAGLTTADKGALLDAKAGGFKTTKPFHQSAEEWNIDLALAQIAEMETAQTPTSPPLTWNERINQMSAEEKGEFFATFDCRMTFDEDYDCGKHKGCKPCMIDFFNSPYTEGATK